jgi:sulfur carrier protein
MCRGMNIIICPGVKLNLTKFESGKNEEMRIVLNNREEEFGKDSMSISEMLNLKKFSFKMRIIKVNGNLIVKEKYDSTIIHDGDDVQMIYLMSGG